MTQHDPEQDFPHVGDWSVIHTRSRQEKALARELAAQGILHFLPLLTTMRCYARRPVAVEQPVFAGCLFLRGSRVDLDAASRSRRVAQVTAVERQAALDHELRNVRFAMARRAVLDPHPFPHDGVRVAVRDGPFRGLQGVVEARGRRDRLILRVEVLGRAASVEIDPYLLEVIA